MDLIFIVFRDIKKLDPTAIKMTAIFSVFKSYRTAMKNSKKNVSTHVSYLISMQEPDSVLDASVNPTSPKFLKQ